MQRAGRRDRKLEYQRSTLTEVMVGAPEQTWSRLRYVWAEKIPLNGTEAVAFLKETAGEVADWVVPFDDDLTAKDRFLEGAKVWDIISLREIGRREAMRITAVSRG